MMSPRTKRQLIMAAILCVWTAAGLVLYWGWMEPTPLRAQDTVRRERSESGAAEFPPAGEAESRVTVESFAGLWDRPLRRVLYDPPPPPKPKPPPPKPPPRIQARLLATMIEADTKTAMLQLNGGQVVFRKIGDVVSPENESATIADIQPGKVVIRQEEHESEYIVEGQGGR